MKLIEELGFRAKFGLKHLDCTIETQDKSDNRILSLEKVHYLLDIYSELLENIKKHSQADKVHINIEVLTEEIFISVQDNGVGFDLEEAKKKSISYGLDIMEKIAIQISAILEINSEKGRGTEVEISLKM